jgi:alpha-methylacyl-CoA racemase
LVFSILVIIKLQLKIKKDYFMSLSLTGIKVLDLTRLLPGAICTLFLADMGADIIKIEDPFAGDYARWTPPMIDGQGAFFRTSNRNKRSAIINLKTPEGQAVLHELVKSVDVLIEGFRPNVTTRLRVDDATLRAINPRLVYCSLSGWGQTGDYAEMSGHDLNYVALSGLLGSMATPQPLGGQIADVGGAYAGALGIVGALFNRERSGLGAKIDIALFESAMPFAMYQWVETLTGYSKGGAGSLTGGVAFYQVYISQDNQPMAFAPIEPKFWENFCNTVQHPEWIPLHILPHEQDNLKAQISALFRTRTAQAWHELLAGADCCFTLITPPEKLLEDPQIQARGMMGIGADGVGWMRSPVHIDNAQITLGKAPEYGEHTDLVLQEAGFTLEQLAELKTKKAVGK